jgi:lipid-A-disaccharide synthase
MASAMISAGDVSGDQHAAGVCKALHALVPHLSFSGIGGHAMQAAGVHLLADQSKMRQVGVMSVLKSAPYHWQLARQFLAAVRQQNPNFILLVDYGGFHLRLAKALRQQLPQWSGKLIYFIPPQVWASRPYRINTLKQTVDHVLGILPFEQDLYAQNGIPYTYVGHPTTFGLPPKPDDRVAACQQLGLNPDLPILAVFPGSRTMELDYLLPVIKQALPLIQAAMTTPVQVVLAEAPGINLAPVAQAWQTWGLGQLTISATANVHTLQAIATAAIVKSGTSTLETAWYGTPQVIIYKAHAFSYWVYRTMGTVPCVGLPNLLLNANASDLPYPECLQNALTPVALARHVLDLLTPSTPIVQRQQQACTQLHNLLATDQSPYENAAQQLYQLLEHAT